MKWKIKSDLELNKLYGANCVVSDMLEKQGEIFEADNYELDGVGYSYKGWRYTREMVEPVDTTVEVTMADIAEAMNISIDDLKIIN